MNNKSQTGSQKIINVQKLRSDFSKASHGRFKVNKTSNPYSK